MHLIESAKFNKDKDKVYLGVPGNLVAYACKVSVDKGYHGFLAFDLAVRDVRLCASRTIIEGFEILVSAGLI
jgi:hypothetical protein